MGVVLAVEMCRILVPRTWDRDGPKHGTTPVAELMLLPFLYLVKYLVKYLVP